MIRFLLACLVSFTPASAVQMYPCKGSAPHTPALYAWSDALAAIRQVETGGEPDNGIGAVGDNGHALGPFQIWMPYHFDAAERDSSLKSYKSCLTSLDYSERVVQAYMGRYAKAEAKRLRAGKGTLADVEKVARIHNGGPRGHKKKATMNYWRKVRGKL